MKQEKNPGLTSIQDDFDLNKPQLNVKIDQKKAADLGISTEDIGKQLRQYLVQGE